MALIFDKQLDHASLTGRIALGISLIVIPLAVAIFYTWYKLESVNAEAEKLTNKYVDIMQSADAMVIDVNAANKEITKFWNEGLAEVRKLAERCAQAAKEINVVSSDGQTIAKSTDTAFSQVIPSIEKSTALVQEIASACREQATGSDQINTAVQRFNFATQQFASMAEEVASNSAVLQQESDNLLQILEYFKQRK